MTSYARSFLTLNAHQKPTVGDIKTATIQDDHMGWLLCDGRAVDIKTFYFLYQVIGDAYGSAPADQFRLPNSRGRVPGFVGTSVGNTWALGDVSGQETHTLTIAEMPSHNHGTDASNNVVGNGLTGISGEHIHDISDNGHAHGYVRSNDSNTLVLGSLTAPSVNDDVFDSTTDTSTTGIIIKSAGNHQHTIKTQGGDQPHNNMQPTIFVGNMFIYSGKPTYGKYPLPMPQTSPYPIL